MPFALKFLLGHSKEYGRTIATSCKCDGRVFDERLNLITFNMDAHVSNRTLCLLPLRSDRPPIRDGRDTEGSQT